MLNRSTLNTSGLKLTLRGKRTGAYLHLDSVGIDIGITSLTTQPDDLIADIRDVQETWKRMTDEIDKWAAERWVPSRRPRPELRASSLRNGRRAAIVRAR